MKIDLHGLTEIEAVSKIEMFLMDFERSYLDEAEIITGNGMVLKGLVIDTLNRENYSWYHRNNNYGSIIVKK